ncbi:MAG TPA: hypothetical protein PK948_12245 [Gemmatimonadales bacterium]|nr:hypothetical protein [Gemmatimonadales bacterium]
MPAERHAVRDGLVIGLIAYAAVALFYAAFDVLAARGTLFTVDLLGKALFRGLRDPSVLLFPPHLDAAAIFWYNAFHLVMSLAIGVIVSSLIARAEDHPGQARAMLFVIVAGFFVTVVAVGWLTAPMRALLPWWSIVVANAAAVVVAGSWLLRRHPGIGGRMLHAAA